MAHSATALRAAVVQAVEPEVTTRLPARAGWFPDPERQATTRFFDGSGWTEHTRGPAPAAAAADAAAAAAAARRAIEARSYGRFENRPAFSSLVLGAISIVLNPLLVPSILAVVLGLRGLRRSRMSLSRYGRQQAATGIVLAIIGVATAAVTLAAAVALVTPSMLHAQRAAEVAAVRAAVVQHVADRGAQLTGLDCPVPSPGASVECTATTSRTGGLKLDVLLPAGGGAVQVSDHPVPPPHRPAHRPRHR